MRYQLLRSLRPVTTASNRALWYQATIHVPRGLHRATIAQRRWLVTETDKEAQDKEWARKEAAEVNTPKRNQDDRPWHRADDAREQDNAREESGVRLDKTGRLLTTPTRLLKLIVPLPFDNHQKYINKPVEQKPGVENEVISPLALLIHPQQPLSYLERLIQAEVPPLLENKREKIPDVVFWAEADAEATPEKSGKQGTNVASYHGLGREGPSRDETNWVRWSGSTEIGDFIRDAARGREFSIDIEGHDQKLRIAVPSFKDRTHYMRMRLRQMGRQIDHMSKIKTECDLIAHKGAHRLAQGGFAALASWWATVYYVTFHTEMGWDMVEPVTYLAGLTTIMAGYLWFLFISRDLSYKAAMNITVSRRQNALYQDKGFDLTRWEHLANEANSLRRDIRMIATEYGVDWDETKDLGGFEVKEALEEEENGKDEEKDEKKSKKKNDNKNDHAKDDGERRK